MNLSLRAARSLPLAAAVLSGDDVVAMTPEWRGRSLGTVTYLARGSRLLVDTGSASTESAALLDMLLDALDDAAHGAGAERAARVCVLAASLRVLAGRTGETVGTAEQLVANLRAAVRARSSARVEIAEVSAMNVDDPAVVALIATQVVANADRHDSARTVHLAARDGVLRLSWRGDARRLRTARRRADRTRWGLGFARIAADALGAVVGPPLASAPGEVTVSIDLGVRRLALPLCAVQHGRVRTATASWDEETGLAPGAEVSRSPRLVALCSAAAAQTGEVATVEGWTARVAAEDTWVAIPPDGIAARVADVLDGIVHERALWDGVPVAPRARIVALAALLGTTIGIPLPRVPAVAWNAAAPALATALGYRHDVPQITGVGAVDPQVVFYLASDVGGVLTLHDDMLTMQVDAASAADPRIANLVGATGALRLS